VARIRPECDEWAEPEELESKNMKNILGKIEDKLGQLLDGEINIVVLWSSTGRARHTDIRDAFACIQQENAENPQHYEKLSGVLFTEEEGVDVSTLKQYYLFKNDKAFKPIGIRLAKKLEFLQDKQAIKGAKALDKAIQKLRST
jgi:hypothetical protein